VAVSEALSKRRQHATTESGWEYATALAGAGLRLIFELTERFESKGTTSGTRARMTFVIG
jgi:hypothetical protein